MRRLSVFLFITLCFGCKSKQRVITVIKGDTAISAPVTVWKEIERTNRLEIKKVAEIARIEAKVKKDSIKSVIVQARKSVQVARQETKQVKEIERTERVEARQETKKVKAIERTERSKWRFWSIVVIFLGLLIFLLRKFSR